jgi:predicted phage terminase large subunit-like protein
MQNWADYTVIITALIYGGRFYVVDMQRGRMDEYELPRQIAMASLKWKPKRICIEDNHGRWIGREIYREMDRLKTRSPIEFVSLGKGDKKVNAKMIKAKPVLRFLGDERLLFANSCPGLEELYTELEKFGTASSTHDDIVDALSLLVNQFASYADMEAKTTAQQANIFGDPQARAMQSFYEATYCLGQHAKDNLAQAELENPEASRQQLMREQFQVNRDDRDPLEDLFF